MTSEIRIERAIGQIGVGGLSRSVGSPTFRRTLGALLVLSLSPLTMWLLGTAIVEVAPPVYQSEAVLRLPASGADPLASLAVIDEATLSLAAGQIPDPMMPPAPQSNLTLKRDIGPNMIQVATRGHNPQEAQRKLMAVVESYEHQHATSGSRLLVYAAPEASEPVGVSHGMRMVLGCAGLAVLGLLLSIPLLRKLEGVPLLVSGRELVSAIARAFAATGLPRASGYLPAVRHAG